jgi:nucleotide-binding universal stress UspA family protein
VAGADPPTGRPPVLLCYDGSDAARRAIEHAGVLLGGGPAVVVTIWESVGSAILRHRPRTALGRELKDISAEVVEDLDAGTAGAAEATAQEGAGLATAAGFDAVALAHRAIARAGEREEVTVWQALLDVADERDARALVLGRRGHSGVRSLLMGSVSSGVLHHTERPVLVVA